MSAASGSGVFFLSCRKIYPLVIGRSYEGLNGRAKRDSVCRLNVPTERFKRAVGVYQLKVVGRGRLGDHVETQRR